MARTDLNVCTFTGNVVADPIAFSYGDGKKGCRLRLAVNNYGEKVAWLSFTAFNGLAEKVILPYVKKGHMVVISAQVETRPMEGLHDKDGKSINRTDVAFVIRDLTLTPNGERSATDQQGNPSNAPAEEPVPF